MAVECSSSLKRRAALGAAAAALALLGGCVVAPVEPYEIGAPVVYSSTVYAPYGGSVYYSAPVYPGYYHAPGYRPYWGPAVSIGIWGGSGGRHWHGHRRPGGSHWRGRPPSRGFDGGRGGAFRGGREGVNRRP